VVWADADTLLLASALGEGQATKSGYARTVRLWRRGQDPLAAPEIFATGADSIGVGAEIDHDNHRGPFVFVERIGFFDVRIWLGGPEGKRVQIPVPTDAWCSAHRDWIVVRPRTPWSIVGTTHQPGTLLGIGFESLLAGGHDFTTLFTPGPRRALSGFHWANGKLVVHALDDLQPEAMVFTPGAWTSVTVPGLPKIGVAGIWRLDAEEHESDGSLLFSVSGPLTPPTLMLTDTALAAPQLLKRAPAVFDAAGLVVTRHDALSPDGTRIPYVQVGPPGETGDAPVHMYGYGGFNVSETPTYRGGIGKLWLERGGTSVTTNLRGGGEFGPEWHESGRREGKARSHDDFAAVASDLVRRGVTRPGRIAAEGGSNGGLLITNMLTRYPECFGALFCTIPLIDMRRYHRLLAGASWIDEYGDPDKPEDWAFLRDISAYHQAVGETKYPPILLATTRRDDRVHPGHARKMAAKLQAMGQPAWFYELEGGGHGYGRTNRERAFFTALGHSFLRAAIGWNFATKSS
jgi:prolyl oligopeptidase